MAQNGRSSGARIALTCRAPPPLAGRRRTPRCRVSHPLFGYRVSYKRLLEIQVRLLARVVTGELSRYPGFETR
jgi:hypothetical protein